MNNALAHVILGMVVLGINGCVNLSPSLVRGRAAEGVAEASTSRSSERISLKSLTSQDPTLNIPIIRKIARTSIDAIDGRKPLPLAFHALDARNVLRFAQENFGVDAVMGVGRGRTLRMINETGSPLYQRIQYYTALYLTGPGFVARDGTRYQLAKGSKDETSFNVADALTTIIAEATYDYLGTQDARLATPVWRTSAGKWATRGNNRPSVLDFDAGKVRKVTLGDRGELTEQEYRAVLYLAELAAQQSKLLSGTTMRLFGKADVGIGAGLGFSLGDNEIISTVVEAYFENTSRRVTVHNLNMALTELSDDPKFAAIRERLQQLAPLIAKANAASHPAIASMAASR